MAQTSLKAIFEKTRYNRTTLTADLRSVETTLFLLAAKGSDFADVIGLLVLRFVVGSHQEIHDDPNGEQLNPDEQQMGSGTVRFVLDTIEFQT